MSASPLVAFAFIPSRTGDAPQRNNRVLLVCVCVCLCVCSVWVWDNTPCAYEVRSSPSLSLMFGGADGLCSALCGRFCCLELAAYILTHISKASNMLLDAWEMEMATKSLNSYFLMYDENQIATRLTYVYVRGAFQCTMCIQFLVVLIRLNLFHNIVKW